jgi:hypothetical protein
MLEVMSPPEGRVRLQIFTTDSLRRRLKAAAAGAGVDMGELGSVLLDHMLGLIEADKLPAAVEKAIEALRTRDA